MANLEKRNSIWYISYVDFDGKRRYKSCGKTATKVEAQILLSEYSQRESEHKSYRKSGFQEYTADSVDLYILIDRFIAEYLPLGIKGLNKKPTTIRREATAFTNFVDYLKKNQIINISQIDDSLVVKYLYYRQSVFDCKNQTLWHERRVIRKFFIFLMKQKLVSTNPVELVPVPTISKNRKRFFTQSELKTIFENSNDTYAPIFEFLYLTGIRSGELCNLRWSDYSKQLQILTIRGSHDLRYSGNKFDHDTEIPTSPKVQAILERQKGKHQEFIFVNSAGQQLKKNQIYKIFWTVAKNHNIKDACVHTFRHTCASHLVIQGVSIYKVSKYLRHTSVKMTEIYAHLQPNNLLDDVSIL